MRLGAAGAFSGMRPGIVQVATEAAYAEDTLGMLFQLGVTAPPSAA
ncbi:hypothetical protein [Streptomyces monomycini]|nr:hypothetical protein [Streptomyces monomycini]